MVSEIGSDITAEIRRRAHESLDMVIDQATGARENSKETIDNIKENVTAVRKNANEYISKNQEKSVLIAAGIGFIVGALLVAAITRKKQNIDS